MNHHSLRHLILLPELIALAACVPAGEQDPFAAPLTAAYDVTEAARGTGTPDADATACYLQ